MGNDFSKGVDSAVSIITGIITGDIAGGLAGASAPWLAEQIKLHTGHLDKDGEWVTDNLAGNLISHAILGAVVAELQGNSGLAGGAGAVAGELANKAIIGILYGDKKISELSEEEKQTVSALSQLATGLAAAATGGNFGDASAAISSSKNAVENNRLSTVVEQRRINELAKDNELEKLLYHAAACALVHCSAEFADDDPMKVAYQKLEELGNSDELQAYRQTLASQEYIKTNVLPNVNGVYPMTYETVEKLFEYTSGDEFVDSVAYINNKYSVTTRLGGVVQVLGAFGEGGLAVALSPGCATVMGCVPSTLLIWSSSDNLVTGGAIIINGKNYTTLTGKGLAKALNISESDGDLLFNTITGLFSAKKLSDLASSSLSSGNKLTAKELDAIKSELDSVGNKLKVDPHAEKGNNIAKSVTTKETGYIKQGDNIVGPRGGVYTNTGQVDAAGNPIYKNNGSYYIFEKNEKINVPSPGNTGTTTNGRPTPVDSERDVGKTLTPDFNAQESYLNGQKVKWGTDGSVRPDFCNGTTCSIEVKNYDIQNNINGLIDNVSKQAIERKKHLPSGVQQLVVIDIRGQEMTALQEFKIKQGIKNKSNGIIKPEQIEFKTK